MLAEYSPPFLSIHCSIYHFHSSRSFGILFGIGAAMVRETSTLMLNQYFKRRRERAEAFSGKMAHWREGTVRALMALQDLDADGAFAEMARLEAADLDVPAFYAHLQALVRSGGWRDWRRADPRVGQSFAAVQVNAASARTVPSWEWNMTPRVGAGPS